MRKVYLERFGKDTTMRVRCEHSDIDTGLIRQFGSSPAPIISPWKIVRELQPILSSADFSPQTAEHSFWRSKL